MAEKSFVWAGTTLGDADQAPYDADEWSGIWNTLFIRDNTDQGYIDGYLNELIVTNPFGVTIRIDTGGALVDGNFYETDAVIEYVLVAPSVSTRIDRIVLRKSWAAQTVRVAKLAGVEGAGAPTLTQTDGVTWEIPLGQITITTGSTVTVLDERVICRSPLGFTTEGSQVVIETLEGDGLSNQLDFIGIPASYEHLLIIGQGRSTTAAIREDLDMRFNADGGGNYDFQELEGQNATVTALGAAGDTEGGVGQVVGASGIAGHVGNFIIHIPNYKNTVLDKAYISNWGAIPNITAGDFRAGIYTGHWNSTVAINRIQLILTGNWLAGSSVTLYGIKG